MPLHARLPGLFRSLGKVGLILAVTVTPTSRGCRATPAVVPVPPVHPVRCVEALRTDARPVVVAGNRLAFDLYARLRRQEGTLVLAPVGITRTLAMAWEGAAGEIATELARGLHLPSDP